MRRKPPAKELLRFSRKERTGILILLLLMIITGSLPHLLFRFQRIAVADTAGLFLDVQAFEAQLAAAGETGKEGTFPEKNVSPEKTVLFYFDPNTLPEAGWRQLGVSARTAVTIQRYLGKGGHFRQAADLQRIYGMPPAVCQRLMPYVKITQEETKKEDRQLHTDTARHFLRREYTYTYTKDSNTYHPKRPAGKIDINTADTLAWQTLPGIGPSFARRIVAFRDKLGGFYATEQVAECYGLPDSTFQKIQPFLQNGNSSLKKIDLNLTDEKSLASHPYIRYKLARLIVQYRSAHGGFRRVEELRNLPLVDEIIYRKIEHYIVITF